MLGAGASPSGGATKVGKEAGETGLARRAGRKGRARQSKKRRRRAEGVGKLLVRRNW